VRVDGVSSMTSATRSVRRAGRGFAWPQRALAWRSSKVGGGSLNQPRTKAATPGMMIDPEF
jgi:hypothetical protein